MRATLPTAVLAHVRKELRDQRPMLIGVFAALPVLTGLAFYAFEDRLVEAPVPDVAGLVLPIALVLLVLAVAADVFAGEVRRGTIAFLRRMPLGLPRAFASKLLVTALTAAAVMLWQAAILYVAFVLWGRGMPFGFGDILASGVGSPWTGTVAVAGAWILLASTWLKHGGVAVLLAPMLLGVVALPTWLWVQENELLARYLVPNARVAVPLVVGGLSGLALLAAAWSFLGGRRVLRSSWSAAWRGLLVVGVLGTAAYAYGAFEVHAVTRLTPASEGFRIGHGLASPGGERLFLQVYRVDAFGNPLTPTRTWTVDVALGAWRPLGSWGEGIMPPRVGGFYHWSGTSWSSIEPQPRLLQHREAAEGDASLVAWIDSRTGETLKVVPGNVSTPETRAWYDEAGRTSTWIRDAAGDRVWWDLRTHTLRREGVVEGQAVDASAASLLMSHPGPGGWFGRTTKHRSVFVDADTGGVYAVELPIRGTWIAPGQYLGRARDGDRKALGPWILHDVREGTERPATNVPDGFAGALQVLGDGRVLYYQAGAGPRRLMTWDPTTGATVPLGWPARATEGIGELWTMGRDREGRGCLVVQGGDTWHVLRLHPEDGAIDVLAEALPTKPWVFALLDDGTAIAIEEHRRVVRYGPDPDRREVLFPR